NPLHLRAAEVGVGHEARPRLHELTEALAAELVATRGRAPALPDDRRMNGTAGVSLPDERCLALVRDAERGDFGRGGSGRGDRVAGGPELALPDLGRIVSDPAGLRIDLAEIARAARHDPARAIEQERLRARSSLIESEDVLAAHQWMVGPFFFSFSI